MTTIYNTVFLDERVPISPGEISSIKKVDDIKSNLATKLKEKYEGKCNANGYVRPGSLEIIGRSYGRSTNGDFTGNWVYDCKFKCSVLYPVAGMTLPAEVIKVNKMGAYAHFDEAIRILLPRDTHVGNKKFDEIAEGDTVQVVLERSRFQANDPYIMAVGALVDEEKAPAMVAKPAIAAPNLVVNMEAPAMGAAEAAEAGANVVVAAGDKLNINAGLPNLQ
jgi:DNA-directed RNA polymerase subunit E'/Rpb7